MGKNRTGLYTWRVEGTVPHESNYGGTKHMSTRNVNLQVVAATLEEVLPAVRNQHPDFRFIKVMADRWIEDVIVVQPGDDPNGDD